MLTQGVVGPSGPSSDGTSPAAMRQGKTGEMVIGENHARYYEATVRGNRFWAANQAAQATSVALATTYTGIMLTNPTGSGKNLVLDKVSWALSVAPAAIASVHLIGNTSTTAVTHTTPLTVRNCLLGGGAGVVLADSAATIPTPIYITALRSGFTAAALPGEGLVIYDMEGSIVVPPGGFIGIGTLTATTGFGYLSWEEVPV